MKVYLGTDHAGFELKEKVKVYLKELGYEVEDCGAYSFDKDDDYPDFIGKAAEGVSKDPENSKGIIFGGSGQGEAIVANKYKEVRAVVFYTPVIPPGSIDAQGKTSFDPFEMLKLTRDHNNSNMLSLGFRFLKEEDVFKAVKIWLEAPFTGEERHRRRIEKIKAIENNC